MAENLPDAPWTKQEELQDAPWLREEPDEGYLPAAGRAVRGLASGLEAYTARNAPSSMSFMPGALIAGKMAEYEQKNKPSPADKLEAGSRVVGEVLPTFAIPGLGAGKGLQALAGNALMGGVGGAMLPEGNTGKNIATGALAGLGTGALGAAYNALPWQAKHAVNIAAAGFAADSLKRLGIDQWYLHGALFWELYRRQFADLVARWSARLAPGIGAGAAQGRRLYMEDDNR